MFGIKSICISDSGSTFFLSSKRFFKKNRTLKKKSLNLIEEIVQTLTKICYCNIFVYL